LQLEFYPDKSSGVNRPAEIYLGDATPSL